MMQSSLASSLLFYLNVRHEFTTFCFRTLSPPLVYAFLTKDYLAASGLVNSFFKK